MKRLIEALGVAILLLASAVPARAQPATCVGTLTLDYDQNPPLPPFQIGDKFTVRGSFGSGNIFGGTAIGFNLFQYYLDCVPDPNLEPSTCIDMGAVFSYDGDQTITTNCPGVNVTSNNPAGGPTPNKLVFDFTPALLVPPNQVNPPGFCEVSFQVTLTSFPAGGSVEAMLGYELALCNNGLSSGGFQTALGTLAPPGKHYDCYQTPRGGVPSNTVDTVDLFGPLTLGLSDVHRLCTSANKNGENPAAPFDPLHYAAYTIKSHTPFAPVKGLTLVNQFGTYTGDAVVPNFLFVPASKDLTHFIPSIDAEHFVCYQMRNVKGPTPKKVNVRDQFLVPPGINVDITTRVSLCVGATKNGLNGGSDVEMCFHTENDRLPFPDKTVFLTTQFGQVKPPGGLKITQFDELCVVSVIQ